MSVNYWLFSFSIDDESYNSLKDCYLRMLANKPPISVTQWLDGNKGVFNNLDHYSEQEINDFAHDFYREDLMREFALKVSGDDSVACESNAIDIIMVNHIPVNALIAYGLGFDKFKKLPGFLCNSLFSNNELKEKCLSNLFDEKAVELASERTTKFLDKAFRSCKTLATRRL